MMVSQGCLTSFFYTNLATHPVFGQHAVAICLLWDIGGNTPCAQGLLWGLAAYFAPSRTIDSAMTSLTTTVTSPLLAGNTGEGELRSYPYRLVLGGKSAPIERVIDDETGVGIPLVNGSGQRDQWTNVVKDDKSLGEILRAVLYQPILPAFVIGLVLNIKSIGCPDSVDYSMEFVGMLFRPLLYFLIGLYSELITDTLQLRIVATVLGLRYLFAGFFAVILWLWLPFDSLERTTMALSMLSPISTMSMYLVAEYNYPKEYLAMSATLATVSVFMSFVIQECVMQSY
jgi:predicted permease